MKVTIALIVGAEAAQSLVRARVQLICKPFQRLIAQGDNYVRLSLLLGCACWAV